MTYLIAVKPFVYASRRLLPGQDFITKTERDAKVLIAVGKARAKIAAADAEMPDELTLLREEYEAVIGKKPFHGWDAETLRAKIADARDED